MQNHFLLWNRRSLLIALFAILIRPFKAFAASKAMDNAWSLTNEDWRKRLSKASYNVLREEGTERPFSSDLNQEIKLKALGINKFVYLRPFKKSRG